MALIPYVSFISVLTWLPHGGRLSWLLFAPALTTTSRLSSVSGRHGQAPGPPMRGLPRPNCHSHGLNSYTLLPLLPSAAAASAVPNWNTLPLRCRNLCGFVGKALPLFRNNRNSGALPSIKSQGPTYRSDCKEGQRQGPQRKVRRPCGRLSRNFRHYCLGRQIFCRSCFSFLWPLPDFVSMCQQCAQIALIAMQ